MKSLTYEQQVQTVLEEFQATLLQVQESNFDAFLEQIQGAKRIFIAGRGRSGLQMSGFAMRLMHLGLECHVVGDVTAPSIQADDLLILGSGSGKTASLVSFAKRAKMQKAKIALITIAPESVLRDFADVSITIPAPTPKLDEGSSAKNVAASILPMGSLFEFSMAIVCELMVLRLMELLEIDASEMFERHANME